MAVKGFFSNRVRIPAAWPVLVHDIDLELLGD